MDVPLGSRVEERGKVVDPFLLRKLGILELPDESALASGLELLGWEVNGEVKAEGVIVEEDDIPLDGLDSGLLAVLKGNIDDIPESAGFVDSPELGKAPKLTDAVIGVGPDLSADVVTNGFADPAFVGPGAEAEAASGGAPSPKDLASGVAFFWSCCCLALSLAIASASKSCFSHFENIRTPLRVGVSVAATGGNGPKADTTRRLEVG